MSYKIFVAEDEPLILKDTIKKIQNLGSEFEVIGQAFNGEDALSDMASHQPDILLTDIRMPLMDGLSLISKVRMQYPNIICVVLSGYQDFEYARQAVRLGVNDYIVKPLNAENLFEILEKVRQKIDANRNGSVGRMIESIYNHEANIDSILALGYERAGLLHVCINNPLNRIPNRKEYYDKINQVWRQIELEKLLQDFTADKSFSWWIVNGKYPNEKVIVFGYNRTSKLKIEKVAKQICSTLENSPNYLTITIKQDISDFIDISAEFNTLRKKIINNSILGKTIIINESTSIKAGMEMLMVFSEEEMKLETFIKNNQIKLLKKELSSLITSWDNRCISFRVLEINLRNIMRVVVRGINIRGTLDPDDVVADILMECNTIEAVKFNMIAEVERIIVAGKEENISDNSVLAEKIRKYIEANYSEKISLLVLADLYGLTESNLCKVFKKYANETPIDYLMKIRIEKAKKFMKENPEIMLKDIAEMTGFSDQYYFSRTFKAWTNQTPSEYKNSR